MGALRHRRALAGLALAGTLCGAPCVDSGTAGELPIAGGVEAQPFLAQARRVVEAETEIGSPLAPDDERAVEAAFRKADPVPAAETVQKILNKYCLFAVAINPEERVLVTRGPARAELDERGWRQFLVRVENRAGSTAGLAVVSPNGLSAFSGGQRGAHASSDSDRAYRGEGHPPPPAPYDRWLDVQTFDRQPLVPELSGLPLEYRIVQLYSRDSGPREAKFAFSVGQGTQDPGFRSEIDVLFDCRPAYPIRLRILDENGAPTTASLLVRDQAGRVYPSPAKRLAPDFFFQPQIYRSDGDTLRLARGDYNVLFQRGPESRPIERTITVDSGTREWAFMVDRWIDPSKRGWWSGDQHIHAAGCAHYTDPTQGVLPADMERQTAGEDLKVGAVLTWGPCFDYQKQFFSGSDDPASRFPNILHYDIEVSGFGSDRSGHLCLLGLKQEIYPGGTSDSHWPTLGLKVLRWAKAQGAVTATAHSGWGLQPTLNGDDTVVYSASSSQIRDLSSDLPNYVIPPLNGIGANEYVVDVTHLVPGPDGKPVPAIDLYAAVDTPLVWELNMWYHTLNCGYRTRLSGETDFPCVYMERVGMGRSYVKLDGGLTSAGWRDGLRRGRSYVGDGRSHLMDFTANGLPLGENGSEIRLAAPTRIHLSAQVAAYLREKPDASVTIHPPTEEPYWHLERARIGSTRKVPLEVVVNGLSVQRTEVIADGAVREFSFDVPIERSSWVALRILDSSHTNPFFVVVDGKPIRASRRSAEWCLKCVDRCWSQKRGFIQAADMDEALAAYEHARVEYRRIAAESYPDNASGPKL
ncbi:MAG TPA: CehA/McbA family metallohydrolase [Opitutaceae bacterium]|jgi:hypothetical protein